MKWFLVFAACALVLAQQPPAKPAEPSPRETAELQRAFAEANKSELEILLVIRKHLARYPNSALRPDLERQALQAAIQLKDDAQVVDYGELVLAGQPLDIPVLASVTHSLLETNSSKNADRALIYARRTEDLVRQAQKGSGPNNISPTQWRNQTDRALSRALTEDARANAILGHVEEALTTAQRAFETYPSAAPARAIAECFDRLGKPMDAVQALADAFSIPDPQAADADRAKDRARLDELYRKLKGVQASLGTLTLAAYDRTVAAIHARDLRLRGNEPNFGRTNPLDFTLSSLDGKKLEMSSLKGKVLVLDVWATYCMPCREQHPLYEQVKQRFRDNPSVVFLSINTDSDRSNIQSFMSALKWTGPVYFEDGLASLYGIEDLPATILLDRRGRLFDHLKGYLKDHFADLLTERIRDALAVPAN